MDPYTFYAISFLPVQPIKHFFASYFHWHLCKQTKFHEKETAAKAH